MTLRNTLTTPGVLVILCVLGVLGALVSGCAEDDPTAARTSVPPSRDLESPESTPQESEPPGPGDRVRGTVGRAGAPFSAVLPAGMRLVQENAASRRFDTTDARGTIGYGMARTVYGEDRTVRTGRGLRAVVAAIRTRRDLDHIRVSPVRVAGHVGARITYRAEGDEGKVLLFWGGPGGEALQPLEGVTTSILVPYGGSMFWINFESNSGHRWGVSGSLRREFLSSLRLGG